MEWKRVAVFGANAGILPHRLAQDEEEERRVFHVAITRCRQQVVVLADRTRPSPMLAELDGSAHAGKLTAGVTPRSGSPSAPPATAAAGPRSGPPVRTAAPALAPVDAGAEQALRAWRTERSRRDKVPPFIVLHDRTLLAIAGAQPSSLVELRRIDGIGPTKLDLYGEEILAILTEAGHGG
jgi:DNA helicase-2/ATP-dependent DNA helicase PcrA